jgi:hypothetical protein
MQQCNICSSNPMNKMYNYQMFEPDEYVKSRRPATRFIIEGLDTIAQTGSVTDSATNLNDSSAKHTLCRSNNKPLWDDLKKQYDTQIDLVKGLEPYYTKAKTAYDSCNNDKNTCDAFKINMATTQANIDDFDKKINAKNEILDTCIDHKKRCDGLNEQIKDKEKQIADLKGYIATNEDQYIKNMCVA